MGPERSGGKRKVKKVVLPGTVLHVFPSAFENTDWEDFPIIYL